MLKEKLKKREHSKTKKSNILMIAEEMKNNKAKLRGEMKEEKEREKKFIAERIYSFDLGPNFKPSSITVNERDKYTGKYLSKRYIPRKKLERCIGNAKIMRIENALAEIVSPHYKPPPCANFIVFGIVSSKHEELSSSGGRKSKYMKVSLSNYRQQITLSLFDKAFEKYWKLRIGDIIGVLNPEIWSFKSRQSGSGFTFFLKEDTASIIEVGHARDFGYCKTIKRDGTRCKVPIDLSKGDYCEYHMEMEFSRSASKRVELGSNVRMFDPTNKSGERQVVFVGGGHQTSKDQLLVDNSAPKKHIKDPGFSSPEASKAFFNTNYSNPKNVITDSIDETKVQALKRERKLRRNLAKISGGESLRNERIESKKEKEKRSIITRSAFSPTTMNNIGFDPTRRIYEQSKGVGKNLTSKRTAQLLKLLKQKSNQSRKKLTAATSELKKRKRQREKIFKHYEHEHTPKRKRHQDSSDENEDEEIEEIRHLHSNAAKRFMEMKRRRLQQKSHK